MRKRIPAVAAFLALVSATAAIPAGPVAAEQRPASAKRRVPDVRLVRYDRAKATVERAGFKVKDYDALPEDDRRVWTKTNWVIVSERPGPGRRVAKGATVELGRLKTTEVNAFLQQYDEAVAGSSLPDPGKKALVAAGVGYCTQLDRTTALRAEDHPAIAHRVGQKALRTNLGSAPEAQRDAVAALAGVAAIGDLCSYTYGATAPSAASILATLGGSAATPTSTTINLAAMNAEEERKAAAALAILDQFAGTTWRAQITRVNVEGVTNAIADIRTTLTKNDQARALEIIRPAAGNLLNTPDAQSLGFRLVTVSAADGNPLAQWFKGDPGPTPMGL